ncbi:dTDP-glucose 4,6-dehydratase [Timonella senegalensis]|uniref:dTDP-glucose 4,6-dehydratase n=1 Tax=Timonella senegalensis TaxID=1465825 RepID=UPI0002EE613F|nr:dTDP-glucose 4,6-dehydratase [Timonella senegalensis]
MRLLVTGGAGFIGSNFVRWTRESRPEVSMTVLDSFTYAAQGMNLEVDGWLAANGDHVSVVVGDIRDRTLVDSLVAVHDVVIHFAAESHNDASLENPSEFVDTNVNGTLSVLEAVRAHGKRLHHISTDEVFGDLSLDAPAFTHSSPYRPSSPYSASKASADLLVGAWVRSFGVRATVSICSNNYGPFQHVEKFIPRQITELLAGRVPRIYGTGANVRDWIAVDDHSSALWRIIDAGQIGRTYLVGTHNERSNLEVVAALLEVFGRPAGDIEFVRDRTGHDVRYALDTSLIFDDLGWRPAPRSFRRELESLVSWYADHEAWWREAKTTSEERYRRLGH